MKYVRILNAYQKLQIAIVQDIATLIDESEMHADKAYNDVCDDVLTEHVTQSLTVQRKKQT